MALRLLKADENVEFLRFLEDVLGSCETATENVLRGQPSQTADAKD